MAYYPEIKLLKAETECSDFSYSYYTCGCSNVYWRSWNTKGTKELDIWSHAVRYSNLSYCVYLINELLFLLSRHETQYAMWLCDIWYDMTAREKYYIAHMSAMIIPYCMKMQYTYRWIMFGCCCFTSICYNIHILEPSQKYDHSKVSKITYRYYIFITRADELNTCP